MSTSTLNSAPSQPHHSTHYQRVANDESPPPQPEVKALKSPSYGPSKSLGFATLLPLATVLFWSFGMGSALLVWLLMKRISPAPGSPSNIFDGYLVADEGNKTGSVENLDGQESLESSLTGVLIITAISHFSSMAVIPLMALGALHVAGSWLDEQTQMKEGPTPLQLGLVMQMCSSGSWDSVLMTLRYLIRHWKTKPRANGQKVSPLVYRALAICTVVVGLHYGVVVTDLLLTADIGSAYYLMATEVDVHSSNITSTLGTQYNSSTYVEITPLEGLDPSYYALVEDLYIAGGKTPLNHIITVNISTSQSTQDLASMAVIVRPPPLSSSWSWTAPSMGLTAQCQPAPCNHTASSIAKISCIPLPVGYEPYRPIPLPSFDYMDAIIEKLPRVLGYTSDGKQLPDVISRDASQNEGNAFYFLIGLRLESHPPIRRVPTELKSYMILGNNTLTRFNLYLGACQVTLYDVEVTFDGSPSLVRNNRSAEVNSLYKLASQPTPMSQYKAMQVLSFVTPRIYNDTGFASTWLLQDGAMSSLSGSLFQDVFKSRFSNFVSSEMARQVMTFISANDMILVPPHSIIDHTAKLVSRYPLARTLAYVVVVYAHGLLAIILYVGIFRKVSKTVLVEGSVQQLNWRGAILAKNPKPVQELLLVQSRLADPLVIVAEYFLDLDAEIEEMPNGTSAGVLSAQKDAVGMFGLENQDTVRVNVGIVEGRDGECRFGLRYRKNEVLLTDTSKEV